LSFDGVYLTAGSKPAIGRSQLNSVAATGHSVIATGGQEQLGPCRRVTLGLATGPC